MNLIIPESLEHQCSKFVKEFNNFHLIQNEELLTKNVLLTIFKESKSQQPTSDYKKRFEELRKTKKNLSILYKVLKAKGILDEINDFFQFCYNEGRVSRERMSCKQSAILFCKSCNISPIFDKFIYSIYRHIQRDLSAFSRVFGRF